MSINYNNHDINTSGTITVSGIPVSLEGHSHLSTDITDFSSGVNNVLNTVLLEGSGINLVYDSMADTLTINATSSGIISGNIVSNPLSGGLLISDGSSSGVIAENGLILDSSTRLFNLDNTYIRLSNKNFDPNISTTVHSLFINSMPSGLTSGNYINGIYSAMNPHISNDNSIRYAGLRSVAKMEIPSGIISSGTLEAASFSAYRNLSPNNTDNGTLQAMAGLLVNYGNGIGTSGVSPTTTTAYGINIIPLKGYGTITNAIDLFLSDSFYNIGTIDNHYGIYQVANNPNFLGGSLTVSNGLSAPTPILTLGTVSGNTAINYSLNSQIQKLTLNGTAINFTKGTGWDVANTSMDVILEITVSSTTTVSFDSNFITDWYNQLPTFTVGKYLVLLRSMGTGVIQGHYIGIKTN